MKENKDRFINSRVGGRHKILLKEILEKSDMNQSEFLRFAIECHGISSTQVVPAMTLNSQL